MRYAVEIEIDLPRDRVIELFDDPDNLPKWQEGLVRFEHLDGDEGRPGARSTIVFQMGKRRIEMIETIVVRSLPDEFTATYAAPGVFNEVRNLFQELGPDRTKWVSENEFRCTGLMRLFAWLMPGMFRKQSLKYLQDFKAFAETGRTVPGAPTA